MCDAEEGGFALAIAVFALVVLAAIVAGGFFSASQEFHIGRGMREATASFYAGESGVQRILAEWDPAVYNTLLPGDTLLIAPEMLEDDGSFQGLVRRVDDGSDAFKRHFYIEVAGRPPAPGQGERRQGLIATVRFYDLCCDAAIKTAVVPSEGSITVESNSELSGIDEDPTVWPMSACTGVPEGNVYGGMAPDDNIFDTEGTGVIYPTGDSATVSDATINTTNIWVFDDVTYDDLVQMADHVLPGGTTLSGVGPTLTASGDDCDRSDPENWGAPEEPAHLCFDYFPVIHVTGALKVTGNGRGQAILLIDDDFILTGQFRFYGLALIKDDLRLESKPSEFMGGAVLQEGGVINGKVKFSRCAVWRAIRLSSLAKARALERRAWVDLF